MPGFFHTEGSGAEMKCLCLFLPVYRPTVPPHVPVSLSLSLSVCLPGWLSVCPSFVFTYMLCTK